jgi:hypothetical protein
MVRQPLRASSSFRVSAAAVGMTIPENAALFD